MRQSFARLTLAVFMTAAAPIAAPAQKASPIAIACHAEATNRYIADFRRLGPRERALEDVVSTTFVNDKLKYEDYYAECLARWNSTKAG